MTSGRALWLAWSWEPVTIAGLGLVSTLYACGVRRVWREAGRGRVVARWQVWSFATGIIALVIALLSPLDVLGEQLFAAHMAQHLVLILVAAPLIVCGAPLVPLLWAFDRQTRHAIGRWWNDATVLPAIAGMLTTPAIAWCLHVAAIWTWHLPGPYQTALRSEWVHAVEHVSFLGTALLFWWVVLAPSGRRRLSFGMAIAFVLAAGMQGAMLGAILTFARGVWYPTQSAAGSMWGLTPLEDQQLAGVLMWVPSSFVYLAAASFLFVEWLRSEHADGTGRREGWTGY